jgi:hypothetical protein
VNRRTAVAALALAAGLLAPHSATNAWAQGSVLAGRCAAATSDSGAQAYCERVAHSMGILQPRVGMLAAGGNPVPGTASTLGTRLGTLPRFSLAGRITAVNVTLPGIARTDAGAPFDFTAPAAHVDAAVGVLPGMALLPTVGGFGSLDVLASAGLLSLPAGRGFAANRPFTWAAGARLGVLRESFTMPGLSVSGMYRRIGGVDYGDPALRRQDTHFTIDGTSALNVRAAISKRVFTVDAAAGAGWDRTTSDVSLLVGRGDGFGVRAAQDGFRETRTSAFANASWTMLVVSLVGEVGVQGGGNADGGEGAVRTRVARRGFYGGLAARLAL